MPDDDKEDENITSTTHSINSVFGTNDFISANVS